MAKHSITRIVVKAQGEWQIFGDFCPDFILLGTFFSNHRPQDRRPQVAAEGSPGGSTAMAAAVRFSVSAAGRED